MNIQSFTEYYHRRMKNNLSKKKKVEEIKGYLTENGHHIIVNELNVNECYEEIIKFIENHQSRAEEILEEIYHLLEVPFSYGTPHYMFELNTQKSIGNLNELINLTFTNEYEYEDYSYKLKKNSSYDPLDKTIEVELESILKKENALNNEIRRINKGPIKLFFDFENAVYISSESIEYKNHSNVYKILKDKGIDIKPVYVLRRTSHIKNLNFTDFSPTTLIVVHLLFKSFLDLKYEFDLESIDFTNLNATNIQGTKLKGTNLLNANEMLERIYSNDNINRIKLLLKKTYYECGTEKYFQSMVTINLEKKLAFIFPEDGMREDIKREISIKIYKCILDLLNDDNVVKVGEELILEKLPKVKTSYEMIKEIRESMMSIAIDEKQKNVIKSYFSKKYPIFDF